MLGTASQAPTRTRNHNGYLLLWDELGVLFDPGEGTQRQMILADARTSQITHICLTHHHGDHTLGLPGVLQRMALDQRRDPVTLVHPVAAAPYVDRLLGIGLFEAPVDLRRVALPDDRPASVRISPSSTLRTHPLHHRVPAIGFRLEEEDGVTMDGAALVALGIAGPAVGRLRREGSLVVGGRTVSLHEVSHPRPGQVMAFVMDTAVCEGIAQLLQGADLAVVETTFLDGEEDLAARYGHLTAGQAGRAAAAARVRRLVVTHYSQRHPDPQDYAAQASAHHGDVVAAVDLTRVAVPPRRPRA